MVISCPISPLGSLGTRPPPYLRLFSTLLLQDPPESEDYPYRPPRIDDQYQAALPELVTEAPSSKQETAAGKSALRGSTGRPAAISKQSKSLACKYGASPYVP